MDIKVCIIMGSKSDEIVAKKAIDTLKRLGIAYEVHVASAHRTPEKVETIVRNSDAEVFIAIAGLSAALPGVVASLTLKPVIGVPVSGKLNLDSILSIVQMPPGIPVATVGLDRGDNAAILAGRILALKDKGVAKALEVLKSEWRSKVDSADKEVSGW